MKNPVELLHPTVAVPVNYLFVALRSGWLTVMLHFFVAISISSLIFSALFTAGRCSERVPFGQVRLSMRKPSPTRWLTPIPRVFRRPSLFSCSR